MKVWLKSGQLRADTDDMEPMSTAGGTPLPPPPPALPLTPVEPIDTPTTAAPRAALPPVDHALMRPWRIATVGGLAASAALVGWQMVRVFGGEERASALSWGALICVVIGLASLLVWTWMVVENARRLHAPAKTQAPPDPHAAVVAWGPPLALAVGAGCAIVYLQRRLVLPENETSSALPLALAAATLVATLLLSIRPLGIISSSLRRLGGSALPTARLIWVPAALIAIGAASIAAMRMGQLFGDDFDGIAPAWALAVVMVMPVILGLTAMWRGAVAAEDTVELAFDRRNGIARTGVRSSRGIFSRLLRAEALPRLARPESKRIRLLPGANIFRLAMFIGLAALCLVAIVGALVMVLFWREGRNGLLVPAQEDRAWEVLANLQVLQRWLAIGTLAVTTIWAFVSVLNARLASGRRRNPLAAALAWPAAAAGIWWIGARIVDASPQVVLIGFFAQAVVFAVPFLLLERAAIAVQAHRSPLRLSYALGVVLLLLTQGLFGLATLERSADLDDFGPLAGSLAVAALLQLVATLSVTESSRLISDAAADLVDDHNAMVDRQHTVAVSDRPGSYMASFETGSVSGAPSQVLAPPTDLHPVDDPVEQSPLR